MFPSNARGWFLHGRLPSLRDARTDLAVMSSSVGMITLLFGDGRGGFSHSSTMDAVIKILAIQATDLNSDGRPDLCAILLTTAKNSSRRRKCGTPGWTRTGGGKGMEWNVVASGTLPKIQRFTDAIALRACCSRSTAVESWLRHPSPVQIILSRQRRRSSESNHERPSCEGTPFSRR